MANLKVSEQAYPSTRYTEAAAPSTPAAGEVIIYAKTDGALYQKDDAGTETALAAVAGSMATDALWDAAGDLAQGTGANTAAKLSAGTAGKVLTSNGAAAALTWETPSVAASGARVYKAAAQTVTAGVETAMTFDTTDFDTSSYYAGGTPTRLTVPSNGKYMFVAHCGFPGSHGIIFMRFKLNGTTFVIGSEDDKAAASDTSLRSVVFLSLSASDYIEVFASRATGTNIGATANSFSNTFEVIRMGS